MLHNLVPQNRATYGCGEGTCPVILIRVQGETFHQNHCLYWELHSAYTCAVYSHLIGVGAGNPMLRLGPLHSKALEGGSDRFTADTLFYKTLLITDFCRQAQGPQTGAPTKVPRTLM